MMSVFKQSPSKMWRRQIRELWDFTSPTDLVLVIEGRDFHVHRQMLCDCSPVFRVMLESEHFSEKDQKFILLPDKKAEDFQQLLNFIYPFGHAITESTELSSLLDLSREYQITSIRDLCEQYLMKKATSVDQLLVAQEYNLSHLKEKCLKQLSERALENIDEHPRYNELSEENRLLLLDQQVKRLKTYCKKISQIVNASDLRYMPIITHVQCGHKPKSCYNPHYVCQICKSSVLRSYIKEESWKLGLDKDKS